MTREKVQFCAEMIDMDPWWLLLDNFPQRLEGKNCGCNHKFYKGKKIRDFQIVNLFNAKHWFGWTRKLQHEDLKQKTLKKVNMCDCLLDMLLTHSTWRFSKCVRITSRLYRGHLTWRRRKQWKWKELQIRGIWGS